MPAELPAATPLGLFGNGTRQRIMSPDVRRSAKPLHRADRRVVDGDRSDDYRQLASIFLRAEALLAKKNKLNMMNR